MTVVPARTESDVNSALRKVEEAFPIKGYFTRTRQEVIRKLTHRLAPYATSKPTRLLDIGSGPMDVTAVFAQLGYECFAVDDLRDSWHLRDGNAAAVMDFGRQMGVTFHRQPLDDWTIPFPQQSFDIVMLNAVIEHLHGSPRGVLNTAGEFLKTGGVLCVTMPNSVNLRKRLSVLRGKTNFPPVNQFFLSDGPWRGHVREYTLAETVYIVEQTGFKVLESRTFEEYARDRLRPPLLQLYQLACQIVPTLRTALLVVARKPEGWVPLVPDEEAFRQATARSVPAGVR